MALGFKLVSHSLRTLADNPLRNRIGKEQETLQLVVTGLAGSGDTVDARPPEAYGALLRRQPISPNQHIAAASNGAVAGRGIAAVGENWVKTRT